MGIDDFIKVEHVSRTFEEQDAPLKVLDDISFSMAKGELTCLLDPYLALVAGRTGHAASATQE